MRQKNKVVKSRMKLRLAHHRLPEVSKSILFDLRAMIMEDAFFSRVRLMDLGTFRNANWQVSEPDAAPSA